MEFVQVTVVVAVFLILAVVGIYVLSDTLNTSVVLVSISILIGSIAHRPDEVGVLLTVIAIFVVNLVPWVNDRLKQLWERRRVARSS